MATHLLFDLDNTLYSARHGLEDRVAKRIDLFVSKLLDISVGEMERIHRGLLPQGYSTTIEWLITEKGFTDTAAYFAAIYPPNEADALPFDPGLAAFLAGLPFPKALLTNSPRIHVDRFIDKLGIREQFTHIFDIEFNNYKGKPHKEAFFRALDAMNAKPETTLFVDDSPGYIRGFTDIGGKALLLDEFDRYGEAADDGTSVKRIKSLREIEYYCFGESFSFV